MTLSLSVDVNNDIFIGPSGALQLVSDLTALLQACEQAAKTQLGEMVYAVDDGVPNFATIWNGSPNTTQFQAFLRRVLMRVEGVIEITELTTASAGGVLTYRATIKTVFGIGVING